MRTLIDLKVEQRRMLDEFCAERNISIAKAIRMALNNFFKEAQTKSSTLEGQGIWKDRATDGVKYQQALRAEWD